jgi:putative copper export protein
VKAMTVADLRVTLHILAATVWVGGQLTLAALVPVLRRASSIATRLAARRFAVVAWWAFAALVLTGLWNVMVEWDDMDHRSRVTLMVKLGLVAVSAVAAAFHQRSRSPVRLAAFGALSAIAAIAVVFFGVVLAG